MPQVAREYFQRNRSVLNAFHERGAVAYLDLIGFPIYLPSVMPSHLAARSDSFGFYQVRRGELLRPGLSQWSISFVSRTEDGTTDLLSIQFLDSTHRDYAVMSAQSPW